MPRAFSAIPSKMDLVSVRKDTYQPRKVEEDRGKCTDQSRTESYRFPLFVQCNLAFHALDSSLIGVLKPVAKT